MTPTAPQSQVLFLAGMGRSGTTLLERVLGETTTMAPLGEVLHLWVRGIVDNNLCGCGHPFSACPFWTDVGERAFGGWSQVDVERLRWLRGQVDRSIRVVRTARRHPSRAVLRLIEEYAGHYAALYAAAGDVSGRPWVIDSSKQASLPFCLAHVPQIRLRVVHCVRDPRAVAHAWTKSVPRPEVQGGEATMPTYGSWELAAMWTVHNAELTMLQHLGVPRLRVRYEDLADDPITQIGRVADLLGVRPDEPVSADRTVQLTASHTCAGNPGRFQTGLTQITRDDAWRREMPRAKRALVTAFTAPLLMAYGYGRDGR